MAETAVSVNSIFKSFKDVKAVDGISLDIKKGEFVALLGPNGAGKTTLVEMIEGIQEPDRGEILIKGKSWQGNHHELNRILGISLQETWFIEKLSVRETLSLFASFYRQDIERVDEIIELIRLAEKQKAYVKNLSGGQRQRLALGIALINYPEILILDEPTTGLDPNARREIWDILLNLKKQKKVSLILTTHYMEEAQYLCDRIVIIDQGKILAKGTLKELLNDFEFKDIIEFGTDARLNTGFLDQFEGIGNRNESIADHHVRLEVENIMRILPELLKALEKNGININSLQCRSLNLDDLFISLTGRRLAE